MEVIKEKPNTDWDALVRIRDDVVMTFNKHSPSPGQVILSLLMILNTVIQSSVKDEILEDDKYAFTQLLKLSEKVLDKAGIAKI
jgi:hypothetical protein